MPQNILLPESSYVAFNARHLRDPKTVWTNKNRIDLIEAEKYAYCVPILGESESAYASEQVTLYAERYGGAGLGRNGGGARCGNLENVQIKGSGRNQLVGQASDYWHTYGGESISGSIRDALWGEICHNVLPHKSARIFHIIETGTSVLKFDDAQRTNRSLTLRETTLRPAHFIRALRFRRSDELRHNLISDSARTGNAVQIIQHSLTRFNPCFEKLDLSDCLESMFKRFADQAAAARAKRIVHGAITASNICVDGSWVDFGTISTVSDYGPIKIGRTLPHADSSSQIFDIAEGLSNALNRYLPASVSKSLPSKTDLATIYLDRLKERRKWEFLKLTGIPERALSVLPDNMTADAYHVFEEICSIENQRSTDLYPPCENCVPVMPTKNGRYQLNWILSKMATCTSAETSEIAIRGHLDDDRIRQRLVTAYWNLRDQYLRKSSVSDLVTRAQFFQANAIRLNTAIPELYRHNLDAAIDKAVLEERPLRDFIAGLVDKATTLMRDISDEPHNLDACSASPQLYLSSMA